MDKLKKNMVFYLLLLIDFYIVPWFIKDTGSAMIVMLVIIPLICLITSVFYGIRNGFNFWYILIVAIMFAPSIFIFYNSSAWVYVVGYAVIALLGNLIALPLEKDNFRFVEQITRAHFYTPFGVVHYARNLALPLGELSAQPTEREKHDHTKGQQSTGKRPAVTQ